MVIFIVHGGIYISASAINIAAGVGGSPLIVLMFLFSIASIIWIGVGIARVDYHPKPPLQLIYGVVDLVLLLMQLSSVRYKIRSESVNPNA